MNGNYELGRMWKEEVVAYFKVIAQRLFSGNEGNQPSS
jgi:hypothetical protein